MRSGKARLASVILGLVAVIGPASGASAYWTTGGSGTASGTTGDLSSPTGVTATQPTVGVATVNVNWAAPGAPSVAPAGYYVERFVGASASAACGSSRTSLLAGTATGCDDTGVAAGSYSYKVTAVLNSWTATSASSGPVTVTLASASIAPTAGIVGTTVTLSGSGFSPNTAITATYEGSAVTLSGSTATDSAGMIPTTTPPTFAAPASTTGAHPVVVTVDAVSAPPVSFTVQPAIAVLPTSGVAGSTDSISGTGFGAAKTLSATFGGAAVTLSGTTTTDATGGFTGATYTVPNNAAGPYTVTVNDTASAAGATYTINTASISITNPTPAQGTVGTVVTVSGSSFPANQPLSATFGGSAVTLSAPTTDASGAFTAATFTVPTKPSGAQTLTITAGTRSASAGFTVRSSVGAPSPTSGIAGSSVTISGSGFAAGSALTVKVGGTTATTTSGTTSDASGSVNLTFTVPALPAGAYTVTVSDAATNTATSATSFTVVAGPATLAFTAQPASGANVRATGSGTFAAAVAVQDAGGNVRTTDNTTLVTLAVGTNPAAGVLTCTNVGGVGPVTVTNGVANFTGCSITKVGTGYKLTATSSPALTAPVNANSFNITAGTAVGIVLSDITTSPTPALGAPTGVVGSLAYSSVGQAPNTGNALTARISLADQNQNLVTNTTGSAITVGLSTLGNGTVSAGPLLIANGASTSSAAFTLTRSIGVGKAVTLTATVTGTTQRLTVVMSSS